ncbi:MAG: DUF116 domain-containing protein [Candidatus Fermentibacteria bacterium]
MKDLRNTALLFHTGLLLFSIAPAVIVLLTLLVAGIGFTLSLAAAIVTLALFQVYGLLYEKGITDNPIPLRLSFWTLKLLLSIRTLPRHTPEKMVVAMNNRKALTEAGRKFSSDEALILVPHCLQNHECSIRLTFDPDSCERCGKCPIGSLLDVRDRFATHFAIASGGTSARRIVEKTAPSLIVAVACPVDLSLGILDVHPITTVGVLNEWRNGPCFDTWVDTEELEAALELFLY